ncbi:MAG TPA: hypothetical protein VGM24_04465 [Puia sp.]
MKMKPHFLPVILLLACFIPHPGSAQDITGIWRGHFRSNDGFERLTGYDDRYKIEVQIAQTNQIFQAVTYSYKNTEFYGKAEASGTVNPKTKKVLLRELKILEVRMADGDVCIMTCFLQYSKLGEEEFLQGTYTSTSARDSLSGCGKGSIFLHKVITSDFQKESFLEKREKELLAAKEKKAGSANKPQKKSVPHSTAKVPDLSRNKPVAKPLAKKTGPPAKSLAKSGRPGSSAKKSNPVPQAERKSVSLVPEQRHVNPDSSFKIENKAIPVIIPRVLADRSNELVRAITVNNTEVHLNIYDDGAIDNDTVSVYYDNKLIVSRARISDQPVKVIIQVEPSDHPHELVMVAENLGDIPPNTSLMVVRDGDKKYEVRIVSTEQKNAVISFQYKKIE